MKFTHYKLLLLAVSIFLTASNLPAQTEREKGIELYKNGKYSEAAAYLEKASKQKAYKADGEIWNYIGLAYTNQNKAKNAQKAFEKAVRYAPQNSVYRANLAYAYLLNRKTNKAQSEINKAIQLDQKNANAFYIRGTANLWEGKNDRAIADAEQAVALDPKFAAAYILYTDGYLARFGEKWGEESSKPTDHLDLLERAGQFLNGCLTDCPKDDSFKLVSDRAETVRAFLDYFKRKKNQEENPGAAGDNVTPLKITYKPKPVYTDKARQAGKTGSIRIATMFGADGKIKYSMVIKGLGYGLDEKTLTTNQGIQFEPEKIDGKPVSVVKVVVYSFSIY